MKPFQFSLQSVLDYRTEVERTTALQFQKSQQEVDVFEKILEELTQELNRLGTYLEEKDQLTAQELQQSSQYRTHLGEQLLIQRQNLAHAKRKQELTHQAWMQAYQEKEMMEKLKAKQYESYQEEVVKQEAHQLEEYSRMLHYPSQW